MIKQKRLCTICARAGSKGVKNKNIRPLRGKPLLAYSIQQAKESGLFDEIVVSSDSQEILEIGQQWGADRLIERPHKLATDEAGKLPAIQHCVETVESILETRFSVIVDLAVTSPLRLVQDIREAVLLLESKQVANVLSGSISHCSPYFNLVEVNEEGVVHLSKSPNPPIVRRQDAPVSYELNGSVYVWSREGLMNQNTLFLPSTQIFVMPYERSIDIDTEIDFTLIELLLQKQFDSNSYTS